MAGLTPDKLRQAVNVKNTITTPTAEGVKGTTVEVAKGAITGAATGGWVGAAKGAAVSFAKTKAGRRIIAILLAILLISTLALPVGIIVGLTAISTASAYGGQYRSGEAAVGSGQEREDVSNAMSVATEHGLQWPIYLALTTVQDEGEVDVERLASIISRGDIRTLGVAGVVVEGKGLTAGQTASQKKLAEQEREHYIDAFIEYGLDERDAEKVYAIALKWAYGEQDECTTTETVAAGEEPATSEIVTTDGKTYNLSDVQTGSAAKIIGYAAKVPGISKDAILISLMAAMTESGIQNYANKNVPDSLNYPHDAVGEDHDSVGFWQMRQHWGTTAELMDIEYQVKAFFGGPDGPNGGSPRGLFDIPGWETMAKGEAAQAVEVSAYPDRYAKYETLAEALLERFGTGISFCDGGLGLTGEGGHPMGDPSFLVSSGFGLRTPGAGSSNHKGIDFSAGCNSPIFAVQPGTVIHSGAEGNWGNTVIVDHGNGLVTRSAHMPDGGPRAKIGAEVDKGEQIGTVGNTGNSGGCHLHLETIIDGVFVDPALVLGDLGVELRWMEGANGRPRGAQ